MVKDMIIKNKSRGYSGWAEVNGTQYYCRSSIEFIYIHYFHNVYNKEDGYVIKMEDKIYEYKSVKYKPDIFIYHNNLLVKIFEIKYDKYQIIREGNAEKYLLFKEYFEKNNIEYNILYKNKNIITDDIKNELEKWKNDNNSSDISGVNNPMFGFKHSDETKKKIGDKTRERCSDPEYIKFFKEKNKKTDIQKEHMKQSAIERGKIKRYNRYGDKVTKICSICGKEFIDYEKKEKETCSSPCSFRLKHKNGEVNFVKEQKKSYSTRIILTLNPFIDIINDYDIEEDVFNDIINSLKKSNQIKQTMGVSYKTIIKYFGNYEEFLNKLKK